MKERLLEQFVSRVPQRGVALLAAFTLGAGLSTHLDSGEKLPAEQQALERFIDHPEEKMQIIAKDNNLFWPGEENSRPYQPGEAINCPGVEVKIPEEGWTLEYSLNDPDSFFEDTGFRLTVQPNNELADPTDYFGVGINRIDLTDHSRLGVHKNPKQRAWRTRPVTKEEFKEVGNSDENFVSPDSIYYHLSDFIDNGSDSIYKDQHLSARYRLKWYAGEEPSHKIVDVERHPLVSEKPIKRQNYERLLGVIDTYRHYMPDSPYVLVPSSEGRKHNLLDSGEKEGEFDSYSNIIMLAEEFTTSEKFEFVLRHELNHALLVDMENDKALKGAVRKFNKLYRNNFFNMSADQLHSCKPEYLPVFEIFDESTYVDVDCEIGHPGDSSSELFASGLNTLQLYPDEFLDRYSGLDDQSQVLSAKIVQSFIELTDSVSAKNKKQNVFIPINSPLRKID